VSFGNFVSSRKKGRGEKREPNSSRPYLYSELVGNGLFILIGSSAALSGTLQNRPLNFSFKKGS